MTIGERIAQLRKEQNISRQAVSKWENDQSSPDTINLILLSEVLDTDVEYLATGRKSFGRRPPKVITTYETIEKVVEKPVYIEKLVEKVVEKPVIQYMETPVVQYVDRPVVKHIERIKFRRNPVEVAIIGIAAFLIGLLVGILV